MLAERNKITAWACLLLLIWACILPGSLPAAATSAFAWTRTASAGFGHTGNTAVSSMVLYGGRLFAGTYNPGGCQVWSCEGASWRQEVGQGPAGTPTAPGFGNANTVNVSSMAVYGSKLYVGARNPSEGCCIWSYDGVSWRQEVGQGPAGTPTAPGFGNSGNNDVACMAVMEGRLFAGTYNPGGCQVWSYDGVSWRQEVGQGPAGTPTAPGFGDADNLAASSMAVYFRRLYVGTMNNDYASGCQVWAFDGASWRQEVGQGPAGTPTAPGFGDTNNRRAACMAVYNAGLYVGTYDSSGGSGCQVWTYDGANWTRIAWGGFGNASNLAASSLAANGLDLYAGTYNDVSGCEVWAFDGKGWRREAAGGFGNAGNTTAGAMALDGSRLCVGTRCESGCQVWSAQACHTLYFAEGYTGSGFREFLCLGNPLPMGARAAVTYLFPDGAELSRLVEIPAESRLTILVNADVGPDREVSVVLESDLAVVAERPMYFTYHGAWPGGHDGMGATSPSTTWYFAEGYTGAGFEEWICVLNPGNTPADLSFLFHTQEEGEKLTAGLAVPARSRRSFKVNDILGAGFQNALKLQSSAPVVAERPMYFDYLGTQEHHWKGGHCVNGSTELSQVYFFAEGTTRAGFEEWLTLQNPNAHVITVNATYQPGPDQGEPVDRSYVIRPGKRHTIYVPGEVGVDKDVSITLASTAFFMAERPMYFHYTAYGAGWAGGDCAVGARRAAGEWFLAEGYTGEGFHTWLCLQNPGGEDAQVVVFYYSQEKGALLPRALEVPARRRRTVFVNEHAGAGYQLSVRALSSNPIVVERPMYFDAGGGVQGGHDVVGRAGE